MSRFIVRFDDICPGMDWDKFAPFDDFFTRHPQIKPLLGVVPENRDPKLNVAPPRSDFWDQVRRWHASGWTLCQHGYTHEYCNENAGILGIGNKSEFAGMPFEIQMDKLEKGKAILIREEVWQPYFMAPSHSFDKTTLQALSTLGFRALTDGYGLFPYQVNSLTLVPQLFSHPLHLGLGLYTLCLHTNTMDTAQINAQIHFMKSNLDHFISFEQALQIPDVLMLGPSLRALSRLSLSGFRGVRKRLKN